jgi:hypothetical protein
MSNQHSRQAVLLPNREVVNHSQVSLLTHVTETMLRCLRMYEADEPGTDAPQLDGGVKSAIEATVIQTCNRLGAVIEDNARWGLETQQALEKQLAAVNDAHLHLLKAQTRLTEEALTPHSKYRPKLVKLPDSWVAILGDIDDIDNSICGIGPTPQDALDAFDGLFTGQMPEHLVKWLSDVEFSVQQGKPAIPFKQYEQEQDHHHKEMDPQRDSNSTGTSSEGNPPDEDSGDAGPDNGIDRPKTGPDAD